MFGCAWIQRPRIGLIAIVIFSTAFAFGQTTTLSNAARGLPNLSPVAHVNSTNDFASLLSQAHQMGSVRIIVALNTPFQPGSQAQLNAQQPGIRQARAALLADLSGYHVTVNRSDWFVPGLALTVDAAALQRLAASPLVSSIVPDRELRINDTPSDQLIGATVAWNENFQGQNQTIAIVDSGVQENHPFFNNRVIAEACYSSNTVSNGDTFSTTCPNGQTSQIGTGAGVNCNTGYSGCEHGTHVAGIAAGNGFGTGGVGYGGVAIQSSIMAVQVFSYDITRGGSGAFDSDIISGLSFVYSQAGSFSIAAVNMSLGDGLDYSSACDNVNPSMTAAIQSLRTLNIAAVIAAGNNGYHNGLSYPACISAAISVGATDTNDAIASFSDNAPNLSLFAPGVNVSSSLPGSVYGMLSGTSMAAPQVTGTMALLRSQKPGATVNQLLGVLQNTGKLILDSAGNASIPRIQIDAATNVFVPRHKTIGVYRSNMFYLKNANTTGFADEYVSFGYGSSAYPIVGDWSGSGVDRVGVYDQSNGLFTLCHQAANTSCSGTSGTIQFVLGNAGDQPLSGRWDVRDSYNGTVIIGYPFDGVGVFRPSNGLIYLKNALSTGFADETMVLGIPGDEGITGDWNSDGMESPGVYRPSNSTYYLSNQVCNCAVYADIAFTYGYPYNNPIAGDWVGSPTFQNVGAGLLRPSDGFFYLRNTLTTGYADNSFYYGLAGDIPVTGHWTNAYPEPSAVLVPIPSPPGSSSIGTLINPGLGD